MHEIESLIFLLAAAALLAQLARLLKVPYPYPLTGRGDRTTPLTDESSPSGGSNVWVNPLAKESICSNRRRDGG